MFGAFTSFGKLGSSLARAIAAAWSPTDLTALAAWYDPSDLSTMFNDSAGTTPVATPGTVADSSNPVGLIQDKSGNGHHASQSTSTARPLLSARKNSLTHTSQLEDVWTGISATLSGEAAVAPDGSLTATKITETTADGSHGARLFDLGRGLVGNATRSIYIKAAGRRYLYLYDSYCGYLGYFDCVAGVLRDYGAATFDITDAGNGWWRFTAAYTSTVTYTNLQIFLNRADTFNSGSFDSYVGDGVSGIYIWGDQLEYGTTATTYQRVTTDSDYDGDPAKFPYYLKFDGTDDYLSTAAMDLTGTDKVTVFGGLRVLANAYHGLVHFGADLNVDTGGFLIWTRASSLVEAYTPNQAGYVSSNEALSAPRTFVNTTAYDLAASTVATEIALRIDGVSAPSTAVGTSASGNFGNLPFRFGRYSSFFLNGNLYSLIIGGALYDAATILEAETWVAEKTGVTL